MLHHAEILVEDARPAMDTIPTALQKPVKAICQSYGPCGGMKLVSRGAIKS